MTKPHHKKLTYDNIKQFYFGKKILKRPTLDQQSKWNFSNSIPNMYIQYNTASNSWGDSETNPLALHVPTKRRPTFPIKIKPDKLLIAFGDKTSVLIKNK